MVLHAGSALFVVPGGLIVMSSISVPVTLACVASFALLAVALGVVMPRLRASSQRVQESIGDLSQRAQEAFSGIRTIMTFGSQARESAIMARLNRRYLVHNLRLTRLRAVLNAAIHSTTNLVVLGVLVVGGVQVMNGHSAAESRQIHLTKRKTLIHQVVAQCARREVTSKEQHFRETRLAAGRSSSRKQRNAQQDSCQKITNIHSHHLPQG